MLPSFSAPLIRLADDLLTEVDQLAEQLITDIATQIPEIGGDPRLHELFDSTVRDNVLSALRFIGGVSGELGTAAPPVAFEFAKRLAQQGVALPTMLRAYRLGQAAFQQTVIRRLGAAGLGAQEMTEASLAVSSFAFAFIDSVSEQMVAVYQSERDAWLRQHNAGRLARIRAVLNGSDHDDAEAEAAIGMSLRSPLVAVVLWSDAQTDEQATAPLDQQLAEVASALGAPAGGGLAVAADGSTLWAWLRRCSRWELPAGFVPARGVRIALGRPASGVDGFRLTHRQACQAQSLSLLAGAEAPSVVSATQVGPLALIGASGQDLRAWVATTLGELARDDDNAARLRETLWCYFDSGSSLNAAAAELHLHKNTIQYRLRKAEELRGAPLEEQRLALEVALLACRLLGTTVLGGLSRS